MATTFLRWFVIQIAAYGLFALGAALLNTRRRFVAVAWAPIVNNLVCIGILVWFGLWAGHGASLASVELHRSQLVLLGLGTSLGVVLQGVALLPSLRRADLGLLRWRWNPRDEALRTVARLGGLDLRLRAGQPGGPLRGDRAGRQRRRVRPGLVVHLRLRLLPAALRRRSP